MSRYKYNQKPAPSTSAIGDGGATHVRYAHGLMPRKLEVTCPLCGQICVATNTAAQGDSPLIAKGLYDFAWASACTECSYRSEGSYEDLPPLYWRVHAGHAELWAWNRDHLCMLRKVLASEPIGDDPYEYLATYVRREWLRGGTRRALLKAASRVLAESAA